MFDPSKVKTDKKEKAAKAKAYKDIRDWSLSIIPVDAQTGVNIDVREVVCGDPKCAPVDTVVTLLWPSGGKGMFGIPLTAPEVAQQDLLDVFPDDETLRKWSQGIDAPWPPRPELRFSVSDRVECRVGPHPVKGWAPGRIVKLFYREASWPPNMIAPYQILLHDGRLIFAPQDTDSVIRLRPPPAPDAPSSPEINYEEYAMEDEDDYQEDDGAMIEE